MPELPQNQILARNLRAALEARDLRALADLLSPDVRWGDEGGPNSCRNKEEVVATFSSLLSQGVEAEVGEAVAGPVGVAVALKVRLRGEEMEFFHVYLAREAAIAEIRRYDDIASAREAIGLAEG